MRIRTLQNKDRTWAEALVSEHFGSPHVVSRGVMHNTTLLPGLIVERKSLPIGLLQYSDKGNQCEGVILISVHQQEGVGRARIQALHPIAEISNCCRIWLVTPNNNLVGQTFYKAVGLQKVAVYPGAVARSRKLKPDIPMFDEQGVAINDEIDFELRLSRD